MLSKFSVKKPYTIVVAVIMILILGSISFLNLQTDLLPDINLPYLVIVTNYPGASPEEVETVVTKPIEQVAATTSNIKEINSVSNENSSLVIMEFNNDVNLDSSIIELNGNLDMIKGMWDDSISSPMIIRLNPDMLPIMVSSVDIEGRDSAYVSNFAKSKVIPELESVAGVASVSSSGILEEKIEVILEEEKIENLNSKILEKIDSSLSQAEKQMDGAKNEIEIGKGKLDSEEKKQIDKLAEAEKALVIGLDQINEAIGKIDGGLVELNRIKEILYFLREIVKNNDKAITNFENELDRVKEGLNALGDYISSENREKLVALVDNIENGVNTVKSIDDTIVGLDSNIAELKKQRSLLVEKKEDLNNNKIELDKGKDMLRSEMNKARLQILEGEITLNQKLDEFETAKDKAFKEASLEGALNKEMISNLLIAQNFSMPASYIVDEGVNYLVKVGDKIENIDELKGLLLFDTGEDAIGKIYLSDVANIRLSDNSEDIYAKVNGNNAVIMTFQKQSNFSTSEVSKSIKEKMEEIEKENNDLSFTNLMDQGVYIDIVVDSVLNNIIFGGILAILVLIFFLKSMRPTLIIAVSIPISIIFAIAMMYFTGVTINIISLAGLALGVGMLVDNSIVVIENIYRLRNEGVSAPKAAVEGAKEVAGAIMASTITTACVFLPIVFTKGMSRDLFTDMGLTIAYSLFASLLVALTLVPTMSATILKRTSIKETKLIDWIVDKYTSLLDWTLKHKSLVIIFTLALFILSGLMAYFMGTSFIPDMDAPEMSVSLSFPDDLGSEETRAIVDEAIDRIISLEDIRDVGAFQSGQMMSGLMGGASSSSSMSMYVILKDSSKKSNQEIANDIESLVEDLDVELSVNTSNMDMSQLGGSGIEIQIRGREIEKLKEIAEDLGLILENLEGTEEIESELEKNATEIKLLVDKEKAMEKGMTVAQVYSGVSSLLSTARSATSLNIDNMDYPVIVISDKSESIDKGGLGKLTIKNMNDEDIVLEEITSMTELQGLSSINRKAQERYISVKALVDKDHNIGLVSRDLEEKLKEYDLADGYSIELEGENKMIKDSLRDLIMMVALAIVFIYLIMVAQFQSLLSPFIVMFTIPLAFTGGLLALWITGNNISLISMLGFLVLSGVVVNNGIVFVDYVNQQRLAGLEKRQALILTGKTRFRPIMMTAITTILGLSTLSFGMGVGAEMLQPLAIVAIGGLLYATLLTLFLVPVMYDILHKKEMKIIDIEGDN